MTKTAISKICLLQFLSPVGPRMSLKGANEKSNSLKL